MDPLYVSKKWGSGTHFHDTQKHQARAKGVYKGRKKIEFPKNWPAVYEKWKRREMTSIKVRRQLKLKTTTFYRLVAEREEQKTPS
jgi:hypothetical protein